MIALLRYGCSRGLYASRQLARAFDERVDVMAVTGLNRPDFRTIAEFRKRHLVAVSDLFVQVLRLYRAAGLVAFAHVAVDWTSGQRTPRATSRWTTDGSRRPRCTLGWSAREADACEDRVNCVDRRGDETPA